jgi:hypothetical protein
MKKVGTTDSGSILVEMTAAQYDALKQVVGPVQLNEVSPQKATSVSTVRQPHAMAVRRKLQSVRSCILKLKPKNSEEVFRLIKSVYHQSGGISDTEVTQILSVLEKEKFLGFNEDGTVNYVGGLISKKQEEEDEQKPAVKPLISA